MHHELYIMPYGELVSAPTKKAPHNIWLGIVSHMHGGREYI